MKRNNLKIFMVFTIAVIMTACSPKEIPIDTLKLTANGETLSNPVNMIVGDKLSIEHTIPELEYDIVEMISTDFVSTSIEDNKIIFDAISKGSGDITFTVNAKKYEPTKVTIPVNVSLPALEVEITQNTDGQPANAEPPVFENMTLKLAVKQNARLDFKAPEGTTYSVKNNNDDTALAAIEGDSLTLTGKTEGTYTMTVEAMNPDYETTNIEITVSVTLTPVVLGEVSDVGIEMGSSTVVKLAPTPQNAKITAVSDNENVTVSVSGGNITVKSKAVGKSVITVEAVAEGFSTTTKTFTATVLPSAVKLDLAQAQVNLEVGKSAKIGTVTNPKDAIRSLRYNEDALTIAQAGAVLDITAKAVGAYEVQITAALDNYTDTTKTLLVNVTKPLIPLTTSVKSITTNVGEVQNINVNTSVEGVNIVTAIDKQIASVSYADGVLSVNPLNTGSANITVTASKDGYETKTITIPVKITESVSVSKDQKDVFDRVNRERKNAGLNPLRYSSAAQKAADIRAKEIVELFSHTRPDGSTCFTALDETDVKYRAAGENLASGYTSAKEVMEGWIASPGHKENIMRDSFTDIAIGVYESGGVLYWTQFFLTT